MKKLSYSLLLLIFGFSAYAQTMPVGADAKIWAQALKLQKKSIVIDGHNDIPSPMVDDDFSLATDSRGQIHPTDGTPYHSDLSRFKASGLTGEFFSIYVGGETLRPDGTYNGAMRRAMDLIDATYREAEKNPDQLSICTTAADIRKAKKAKKMCVLMGIEGGYAIENSLYALRNFYRLGVRYMTLTHNVTHAWGDAHLPAQEKHGGLTDFGKEVVREMNRLGMLVDISHVSVKVMNDALDVSTAPIIASHSSARGVRNHTRNVPDEVLKRIAKGGGVVMVNFYPSFLDQRTADEDAARSAKLKPQLDALKLKFKDDPKAYDEAERMLLADNPIYIAPYTRIVDHIDHMKKVAGIDVVGIGSDFDGVPYLPSGMNGAEDLVLVTYEMLRRGYTEQEVSKVLGGNFLRAFEQAEKIAKIGTRKISADGSLKKIAK